MSYEGWKSVIDANLTGAFNVSRAATLYFREQQSGSFTHLTSTSGLIGNLGQANYSAAKLGLVALSQSIALDMALSGAERFFRYARIYRIYEGKTQFLQLQIAKHMLPEFLSGAMG